MSHILDSALQSDPERWASIQANDGVSAEEKAACFLPKPTIHEQIAMQIKAIRDLVESQMQYFDGGLLDTLDHLADAQVTWRATCEVSEEQISESHRAHYADMCRKDER